MSDLADTESKPPDWAENQFLLSIVIVTWNSASDVGRAVRSGREQHAQVIVVDNASTDGSAEAARQAGADLVIRQESNVGFAAACNRGLDHCDAEITLFLNPDAWLLPGAVDEIVDFFAQNPEAGILGGAILDERGRVSRSAHPRSWIAAWVAQQIRLDQILPQPRGNRPVGWVSGAGLAIRTECARKLGGFNVGFFLYYEDADLCARVRSSGREVWFSDRVRIAHKGGRSSRRVQEHALVQGYLSSVTYLRLHGGRGAVWLMRAFTVPQTAARFAGWALRGLRSSRREEALRRLRAYAQIIELAVRGARTPRRRLHNISDEGSKKGSLSADHPAKRNPAADDPES